MVLTKHAEKRMRQRLGLNKKSVSKIADKALREGITHAETRGKLHKYLDRQVLEYDRKYKWRIFNGYLYCFSFEDVLITVFPLDYEMRKCVN